VTDDIQAWIGRTRAQSAVLDPEIARRYAAAVGSSLDVAASFPPLGHWAYFNEAVSPARIGPDGHPHRGIIVPPIALPRRMFASAELEFAAPLDLGAAAELDVTVTDIRERSGRTGALVLMDTERRLTQAGATRIVERQTIVFREAGEATPAVPDTETGAGEVWTPGVVDLFRFSAATYNSHRIHYDRAYAREAEGYPDLVVHGPFTASKLFDFASRTAGAPLKTFSFRAQSPLFVDQPVRLRVGDEPNTVLAVRCDGAVAMSAAFQA
jgi:3-methylfumaryl-CoA hydratase